MLRAGFKRIISELRESENFGPVILAVAVGLVGGGGAILFRYLIESVDRLFFEGGESVLAFLGSGYVILLPVVGLFLVNFIVRRWAPEAQGHGVPEVMYAVRKEGGRIRPRVAGIKAIASALCIGSGGSVGREGPIVQIGCSLGSTLGQWMGLTEQRTKLMVACGTAAAIGGTFNAPIAGVIFALEVILGSFNVRSFGVVVIASVTSTAMCRSVLGNELAFELGQTFHLNSLWELPLYLALGVGMGLLAIAYIRTLYFCEGVFESWKLNHHLKAIIGGLAVGVIGYVGIKFLGGRYLFGVGYDGIEAVLGAGPDGAEAGAKLTIQILIALAMLKILATSMTLAAGGSGGVFAPALFIGAMAGGAFGMAVGALFPSITAPHGAYALVGMAALFAGAAHAPIGAILILFEMTDDYKIILPLMLAAVVSHLVASVLYQDSIYTIKLRRRGGLAPPKSEMSVLDVILVADAMASESEIETIKPDLPVAKLAEKFHSGHSRGFPVVDDDGKLVGIVTEWDVESAVMEGLVAGLTAKSIMTKQVITCTPDQTLHQVLYKFTTQDVGRIPVVAKKDPDKLVGVLRREEIFWAYGKMAREHQRLLDRTGVKLPSSHQDSVQVEIQVSRKHEQLAFRQLREVQMPDQCLIVVLRRAERAIVPRGNTVIEPGDVLVALTTTGNEPRLREWVAGLNGGS